MNTNKKFKLSYRIEYNTNPNYPLSKEFGTCLGIYFDTENEVNEHLDFMATKGSFEYVNLDEGQFEIRPLATIQGGKLVRI
jgi:hypothetical protein